MRWVLLTLATSLAFVCASHAQPPASSLRFGPFEFGMTVEEARGAAPNASWREDDVSRATGRAFSIGAEDVLELAGRRYGIAIREGYHGAAGLELRSSETACGPGECRDRAVALVAEVEHRSGRLGASQYSFEPVEPSPYEATLATPRQSRARMSVRMLNGEDRPANDLADPLIQEYALATFASVGEAPYEIRVAITASYDRRRDGECSILAQFVRDGAGPLPPVMTLARARVVNAPTIASRHYMTSHARPQVTTATDMFFTCFVARSDGRVLGCATRLPTRNTASAAGVDAAYGLATLYRFDLGDIDRDDPTPLQIDIDVRVSPTDIRSLDFLSTPARSADEMVFAHVPDDDERNLIYGLFPLPNGTLTLTCQVQSDMSALCENPRSDDFEIVEILRQRTMRLTLLYKLAPRTRSGERSEGIVFDLPIVLEEYR